MLAHTLSAQAQTLQSGQQTKVFSGILSNVWDMGVLQLVVSGWPPFGSNTIDPSRGTLRKKKVVNDTQDMGEAILAQKLYSLGGSS